MLQKVAVLATAMMILLSLTVQAKITDKDVNLKKGLVLYMPFDEGKGQELIKFFHSLN